MASMPLPSPTSSSSSASIQLTEEQRERIRQNRERALKIRKERAEEQRRVRQQEERSGGGRTTTAISNTQPMMPPPTVKVNNNWPSVVVRSPNAPSPIPINSLPIFQPRLFPLPHPPPPSKTCSNVPPSTSAPSTSAHQKPTILIEFLLISSDRFKVQLTPFQGDVVAKLKTIPAKIYNIDDKSWSFLITDYEQTKRTLEPLRQTINLRITEIPFGVRNLFLNKSALVPKVNLSMIGPHLCNLLFPFQRNGVSFGIEKDGRLLMADEMGLGKSVQALAISNYYRTEWPLLVVCPSSVKYAWLDQLNRFMPGTNVYVIEKQSDPLPSSRNTSVATIISYDLMVAKKQQLKSTCIYVIIFDESHLLKELKTQRTIVAFELSKKAHRVILLSGTPALSRPSELFTQIRMINPKIFPSWREYAQRYCEGRLGRFGFEAKGRSNPEELRVVMDKIMIRRLKKDVLEDLPEKRREIVYLSGDLIDSKMRALKKARDACVKADRYCDAKTKKETFMEYYVQFWTGTVKMKAAADHIVDSFFHEGIESKKVLVFAHHMIVLDTVGIQLAKVGVQFIRIDGSTPARDRAAYCEQFQSDTKTKAALLSITAAGTGITLTAASVVVFAELYWNPSLMIQAEDRAHRVGQRDSVHVQYILARNTADASLWEMVGSKLKVLGEVNLSNETYRNAENTEKLCSSNNLITNFFDLMNETGPEDEPESKRGKPSTDLSIM